MVGVDDNQPGENALSTVWRFLTKFASLIVCTLHGFERVLPNVLAGRSLAGFKPARCEDVRLLAAVLEGDPIARGFRNRAGRAALFGVDGKDKARPSAAVGRRLQRWHVRHWLAKIPRTRRWRVPDRGRQVLGRAVELYRRTWPDLTAA